MAADGQEAHRPGVYKQQNKVHKTGKHKSKGQLAKEQLGRVNVKTLTKQAKKALGKEARRHQAGQARKQKRDEVLTKKRRGTQKAAPFLCAIVCLGEEVDPEAALELIKTCDESATVVKNDLGITHISVPRFKQRYAFVCPPRGDLYALLDAVKVADSVLFLVNPLSGLSSYGEFCLSCVFAHCLPTPILAIQGLKDLPTKRQNEAKKSAKKMLEKRFPEEKIHTLNNSQDALLVLRSVGTCKERRITMRENRPHMIAEDVSFTLNDDQASTGTLKLSGYVRGQALSVNGLIHLPGWGDFQMSQIDGPDDPYPLTTARNNNKQDVEMKEEDLHVLEKAKPSLQESLQAENEIDAMDGEQTWPTDEELKEAEDSRKEKKAMKRVPKGTSSYQASWILDEPPRDNEEIADAEDDDDDDDEDEEEEDCDMESAEESDEWEDCEDEEEGEEEDMEGKTVTWGDDVKYDDAIDMDEELEQLRKYKEAAEHEKFPDEVDTPQDVAARVRFQRYRGMKSFRTSPWDPKENLPLDYARIFQFQNYRATKKRVFAQLEDAMGVMPGWYVTVHIINVPRELMETYKAGSPIVAFGLLPHEQKMTVVNLLMKRQPGSNQPIKSKERMILHVGFRRFAAGPVFSEHTHGTKHKFERFFRPGSTVVGTVFAPIMFPPASVLAFTETASGEHELVATGSLLSINTDRIVTKRIILSGHPYKINKRHAVIRYMFFNREDIDWFKPVELRTKYGRHGYIRDTVGTHGHMKCLFDAQLKSQDTVLMNLYKRVFPKWTYDPVVKAPVSASASSSSSLHMEAAMEELFD